jgi:hypothetical protein
MERCSVATTLTPQVVIEEVGGNLQIKGWMRSEIYVKAGAPDTLVLEEVEDGIRLSCRSDCVLRVPREASLQVSKVFGGIRMKYLDRQLKIDQVDGSVGLRHVGEVHIGSIKGDLLAKEVLDSLQVDEVLGNAVVREVQGNCTIQHVVGNLDMREVCGDITAAAGGHASVEIALLSGKSYQISSGGHLNCQVPEDANLKASLSSRAESIRVKLNGKEITYCQPAYELTLGTGEVSMQLSAGGKLLFSSHEADWEEIGDLDAVLNDEFTRISDELTKQIEAQIEAQVEMLNGHLEKITENIAKIGLSQKETERLVRKGRESSEQAAARTQQKMHRAQEKLERKLADAQRKVEMKAKMAKTIGHDHKPHTWDFEWKSPTRPPSPASQDLTNEPVADEERLVILHMLEQKKITLAEAEILLAALEGREG